MDENGTKPTHHFLAKRPNSHFFVPQFQSQELANESVDMVIYLDADMILRPDAREWGLVPFLTRGAAGILTSKGN